MPDELALQEQLQDCVFAFTSLTAGPPNVSSMLEARAMLPYMKNLLDGMIAQADYRDRMLQKEID